MDDDNHNRVKAIESVVLEELTYCQASVTDKILSSLSRGFNSSQEIDTQAGFIFSGKSLGAIPFRDVYVDGEEVSDDLNLNLSDEIDGIPQTRYFIGSVQYCPFWTLPNCLWLSKALSVHMTIIVA